MVKLYLTALLLMVATIKANAQQKNDSLFLYNGQILIGEILGIQLGVLTIDEVDLKMLNIKLNKLKTIKTREQFKFETDTRRTYYGTLQTTDKPGWLNIKMSDSSVVTIDVTTIHIMIPLNKKFLSNLHGNLSAGFSYTKSSNAGQINLSSSVRYSTRMLEFQLNASENASIDSSAFSRDREDVTILSGYYLTPTWFIAAALTYQRNLELSIARRYQEMLGAGNKVLVRKYYQLLLVSGISANQEKSTDGTSASTLFEIPFIVRFNFFKFSHPDMQITTSLSAFVSLSQKDRVRYEGNTIFSWQLVRYFYLNINPYTNFDNQTPNAESKFDYGVVLSLSYKF